MTRDEILRLLNAESAEIRLKNLERLLAEETEKPAVKPEYSNNHIHTFYSFSPYSPTAAVWFARAAGLSTAGIMDHDSIAGAREFTAAGRLAGVGTTCGLECRVSLRGTSMEHRRLNNPDQVGEAYMAMHSVLPQHFARLNEVFAPLRVCRNERNRKMLQRLNALTAPSGISLDFDRDVLPLSHYDEGGSVTERHLLFALAGKILSAAGDNVADFVEHTLGLALSEKQRGQLADPANPYLRYDLLGVLKGEWIQKIYIPATDECLDLKSAVALADELDAYLCYAYLGDVKNSATGDKKDAKFEDDYLEEVFLLMKDAGVGAVTFMPSRNTPEQLARVMKLCERHGMRQISGEDVNSPRQGFLCSQLASPRFRHLTETAWSMVRREANANNR